MVIFPRFFAVIFAVPHALFDAADLTALGTLVFGSPNFSTDSFLGNSKETHACTICTLHCATRY